MFKGLKGKLAYKSKKVNIKIDLHSHLIPEIDDGCFNMEESLSLVQKMHSLGYKKLIITPHIMHKKYPNTYKIIRQSLLELRSFLKVKNIDIEVEAAAEYYCDDYFLSLIKKDELLYFGDKYVLFELPYNTYPENLNVVIESLLKKGYKPVLAHPERYRFLNTVLDYRSLKKKGLWFQVNVNSIGGYYGFGVKKKALMLSQKSMIDFIGSDMHNQKQMDTYKDVIFSNQIEILFRNNKLLNDTL